ncbi:MAG TPA: autotransporter-associated beta strand repeat-containing protein, partial [Tepidisphaeraceae bacterium]
MRAGGAVGGLRAAVAGAGKRRWLLATAVVAGLGDWASADLVHRYSFTSDGTDSVGGATGNVVDPKGTNARFTGGRLDLTVNNGESSNQDFTLATTTGAYFNLPNGIVSSLGQQATFETWLTVATNRNWAEIFSFGASVGGEDVANGGNQYITLIPQNGANGRLRLTHRDLATQGENFIDGPAVLSTGAEHHLVVTYDETNTAGGANPSGTQSLYLDGQLIGSGPIRDGFTLATLSDINNWLGRSQFGDPLIDGSYNEFRIYNNALSAQQVSADFAFGPDLLQPTGTNLWQTPGTGNYTNPSSWDQGHVPTATEKAGIGNGATVIVDSNVGSNALTQITNGALTLNPSGALTTVLDLAPGNGPGTATLNLNGGTLTVSKILVDTGTTGGTAAKAINFNGGTLVATGGFTVAGTNLTSSVGAGGATVDVASGSTVTWNPALTATDPAASLTKQGAGSLVLQTGGFNGAVTVKAGTLSVAGDVGVATAPLQLGDATAAGGNAATLTVTAPATIRSPIISGVAGTTGAYTLNVAGNTSVSVPGLITVNQPLTITTAATTGTNATTITGGITSGSVPGTNLTFNNTGAVTVSGSGISDGAGGSLNVVKNANGVLSLLAPNTYSGTTTINAGGIAFAAPNSIGGSGQSVTIAANGVAAPLAPGFDYTNLTGTFFNRVATNSAGVVALAANSAENFDFSGTGLNLAVSLGAATNVTYTGTITPNAATYRLGGGGGALTIPGANAITGANSLVVAGAGGGSVVLAGANDFSGDLTINGTLVAPTPASLGTGTTPVNMAGTLRLTDTNPLTYGRQLLLRGGSTVQVDGPSLTLTTTVVNNGTATRNAFSKTGPGNLNVPAGIDGIGSIFVKQGTMTVPGTATVNSFAFNSIGQNGTDNGTLVLKDSVVYNVTGDFNLGDVATAQGTMFVGDNAALTLTTLYVGKNASTRGVVVQTGGTIKSTATPAPGEWRIGGTDANAAAAVGTYDISGGSVTTSGNLHIGGFGSGTLTQTGGTVNVDTFPSVGRFAGGYGVLNVTGGTFNATGATRVMIVGEAGYGVLNVSGNGQVNTANFTSIGHAAGGTGVVNLGAGGTLTTTNIIRNNAAAGSYLNFHGGTLRGAADNANFIQPVVTVNIFSEGAVIDTNGHSLDLAANLTAPTGAGVTTIPVANGGSGYIGTPVVRISGGDGINATAVPVLTNGVVTAITVTNPGTGYTTPPTIQILGGGGSGATAGAPVLGANVGGGLTKVGEGTLAIRGNNTYTGDTTVNQGILQKAEVTALPVGPGFGNMVVNGGATFGGTLDLAGFSTDLNGLNGAAGVVSGQVVNNTGFPVTLSVGNADANGTFGGQVNDGGAGGIALTKVGAGTQTLGGTNGYTGATQVNAGTLRVTGSIAGSSGVSVNDPSATFEAAATQ